MGRNPRQKPTRLAEKLLYIRTKILCVSQNEMIRRLGFSGELIQSHISAYEQENEKLRREPPLGVLLKYARLARIAVENLIDDGLEVEEVVIALPNQEERKIKSASRVKRTRKSSKHRMK